MSSSVPVWSMTRAVSAGTGSTSCAQAQRPLRAAAQQDEDDPHQHVSMPDLARHPAALRHFFWPPKSTCGGVEICASFCTVKFGLGS